MRYVLFLILLMAGCSFTQGETVIFNVTCDRFLEDKHLNWSVYLQPEDSLLITLCSNSTTGFQWSETARINDERVLTQVEHTYTPPQMEIPGAPGKESWVLTPLKKGKSVVSWEYSRPWVGGEKSEWTLTATVVVE